MMNVLNIPFTLADANEAHARFWLGKSLGASEQAGHTEWLFMFIMWVNILSFIVLMGIMGWFMLKYRRSKQAENYQVSTSHNTPLELAWSIIPFLVMVPIFWWGMTGYVGKLAAPADAQEIYVTGKKWNWEFKYPTGEIPQDFEEITKVGIASPVLVVEEGRPVKLIMTSDDVLHAFYIPDFRLKMDVIPNRITSLNFTPKAVGEHIVFCAEYCGDRHSEMHARLRVLSRKDYTAKMADYGEIVKPLKSPLEIGKLLYTLKGCATCHSIDGKAGTGPTWKNIYGARHEFTDGSSAEVNDDYLNESILYSQKKIVKGYGGNMPVYAGQISKDELFYLTLYIKSLSDKMSAEDRAKMDLPIGEQPDMPGSKKK
jgi:cytochrome c oxidase subunit II